MKAIEVLNGTTLAGKLLIASGKYVTMRWCWCLSVGDFFPGAAEQLTVKFADGGTNKKKSQGILVYFFTDRFKNACMDCVRNSVK